MKATIIGVLFSLLIVSYVFALDTIPALVWSGKNNIQIQKLESVQDISSTLVVFLHHQLRSEEFLENSGAFLRNPEEGNAFKYLKQAMKVKSSASFPHTNEHEIKSILPNEFNYIITDNEAIVNTLNFKGNAVISLSKFISSPNSYLTRGGKYLFVFNDVHRNDLPIKELLTQYDSTVQQVMQLVESVTEGDYVALFSAEKPTQRSVNVRSLLSNNVGNDEPLIYNAIDEQSNNNSNNTVSGLYIDGNIAGCLIVGFIFVFFLVLSIVILMGLKTSPHITDIDIHEEKKHQ
ncbi:hypothetical protein ABK040_016699 [Willaertia magna]